MKYYRPVPLTVEGNPIIDILTNNLSESGWSPMSFKFWRIGDLIINRKNCEIIHLHWPEGFWRSDHVLTCYIKALFWFIPIFYIARLMGYKWVFSAHNVIPHYKVRSPSLERLMRRFILKNFDLVIGLAFNTKTDLELAFGMSGKKYILALHGVYDCLPKSENRGEFRDKLGISENAKIILSINSFGRENKGVDELINEWEKIEDKGDIHLLITGMKPLNYEELINDRHLHFIEGHISDEEFGNLLSSVDFMLLNYKNITTSGMYFMTIAYDLPIIAPNLPFFKLHSSDKTTLFFDYNESLGSQIVEIFNKINSGWKPDFEEFDKLKKIYDMEVSAKIISKAFNSLI